jgi:hypothetical protein
MNQGHPLTIADRNFLTAVTDIRQNPDDHELAFTMRELVHCTLPHRDPGDIPNWRRQNGDLFLGIRPGWSQAKNKSLGIPYGSIPRLLLFWLTTEAVRNKSRRIELGRSYSEFIENVGLNIETGGGKRSDFVRLKNQLHRLFCATIAFEQAPQHNDLQGLRQLEVPVSRARELWWDPKTPNQLEAFMSWVDLGEDFYNMAIKAPVPMDLRVLKALKRSPLALDLYVWASYKSLIAARSGRPQAMTWHDFMQQFGTEYKSPKNFQQAVAGKLKLIQQLYPALRIGEVRGGLEILPTSRPSIPLQGQK